MDIIDSITAAMRDQLDEWGHIPFSVLDRNVIDENHFDLDKWCQYIESTHICTEDFFYLPSGCVVYYKGFVYCDIDQYAPGSYWENNINSMLTDARKMLEAGQYEYIFGCFIDKRIALKVFLLMLNDLPVNQIYGLFKNVYSRTEYNFDVLTDDKLNLIKLSRMETLVLPGVNEHGFVEVYRGMSSQSTDIDEAYSWTLNLATAVYFACRFSRIAGIGDVYRTWIHQDKIVAYIDNRREDEVIIIPSENEDELFEAELVEFWDLDYIRAILEQNSYLKIYEQFLGFIQEEDFVASYYHGLTHTKRVLMLTICLCFLLEVEVDDIFVLSVAAIYHDIGRSDDGEDSRHGVQSFAKALNKPLLKMYTSDIHIIRYIIENHCIEDSLAFKNVLNYEVANAEHAIELLRIFKDADGLDRFRIKDLDARKLRHPEALDLLVVAWELLQNDE
jgi:hypothetical protein